LAMPSFSCIPNRRILCLPRQTSIPSDGIAEGN
jgi:hypothetical protein